MFNFMTNNHIITIKCRWVSEGAVSSVVGSWWSPDVGSGGKDTGKVWSFYILRANRWLTIEET